MANIKQQQKRVHQDYKKRILNKDFKSGVKTAIKNVERHIEAGDREKAEQALRLANRKLDKARLKNVKHKNFINRRKSRLQKRINAM